MFYQWLLVFTEGEGSFSFVQQNNSWSLIYKIGQSTYNLRVLHFIKKQKNKQKTKKTIGCRKYLYRKNWNSSWF
jgi:hypothetical protein